MEKTLVTAQTKKIRCEIHRCKEVAEFSIGLEGFRVSYTNVCRDCMDTIVRQAGEFLYGTGWTPENVSQGIGKEPIAGDHMDDDPLADKQDAGDSTEAPGDSVDEVSDKEQGNVKEHNSMAPKEPVGIIKTGEYYECEDCGEKFNKPSEKMAYVNHRRNCKVRIEKESGEQ